MSKTTITGIVAALLGIGGYIVLPLMQGTEPTQTDLTQVGTLITIAVGLFFCKDKPKGE